MFEMILRRDGLKCSKKNHEATGCFVAVPRFSPWHPGACAALAGAGEELGLAERLLSLQCAVHQHVLWESAAGEMDGGRTIC